MFANSNAPLHGEELRILRPKKDVKAANQVSGHNRAGPQAPISAVRLTCRNEEGVAEDQALRLKLNQNFGGFPFLVE